MISARALWWTGTVIALAGIVVTFAGIADHYAHWGWAGVGAGLFGAGMMWRATEPG